MSSMFSNLQNQNQPQNTMGAPGGGGGSSLFSSTTQPAPTSLFSGGNTQSTTNPTTTTTGSGLFQPRGPSSQSQRTFAERTLSNPYQTHIPTLLQSGLGGSTTNPLNAASQQDLARQRLQTANISTRPASEKTVEQQVQTLIHKWDPQSQDTLMQTYLYNAVNSAYAPFYHRNADESEREWEAALANKPPAVKGVEGQENISFVPVLVRGFRALGERVEYQARTVNEMRARLHEMNLSLNAVMAKHQQGVSVRLEKAGRQHVALSQRCLRLAVKAQVLRQRGYALDRPEEDLRLKLLELEKVTFDPSFAAREEEIWARMVVLRERARWLEEEGKRLGGGGGQQQQQHQAEGQGVSEEVVQKTKKILRDYDGQISHLGRELEVVRREFGEWEGGQKALAR